MKKLVSILAAIMMLTTSVCAQEISLKINDQIIETKVQPVQESGTTLVPLRIVGDYLGAEIKWNQKTQTVTIIKDNQVIELKIGSNVVKVNGVEQKLQCAPKLIKGTTMVPIRLVSENLGSTVKWEQETGTVIIQSKESDVETGKTTESSIVRINYTNGIYVGEIIVVNEEAIPHGDGIFTQNNGTVSVGLYENGEMIKGKITSSDGNIYEGSYAKGRLVSGKIIFKNGLVQEGDFGEDGNLYEGKITYFFAEEGVEVILLTKEGITGDANFYNSEGELISTMSLEEFFSCIQ